MWGIVVAIVMATLTMVYATLNERTLAAVDDRRSAELAENMALYREAVIDYFTANDVTDTSVDLATLKAGNHLPAWSSLYTSPSAPAWSNYRDAGGLIYVYATAVPAVNIVHEMATLSRGSYNVGYYREADSSLQSPVFGDTGISLAALAARSVPDGAPVWLGRRK